MMSYALLPGSDRYDPQGYRRLRSRRAATVDDRGHDDRADEADRRPGQADYAAGAILPARPRPAPRIPGIGGRYRRRARRHLVLRHPHRRALPDRPRGGAYSRPPQRDALRGTGAGLLI